MCVKNHHHPRRTGTSLFFSLALSSLVWVPECLSDIWSHDSFSLPSGGIRVQHRWTYEVWPPTIYLPLPDRSRTPSRSPYDFTVKPAGRLQVVVHPVDAEVFVDGERVEPDEDADFDLGLLAGKHTVKIAKGGYRSHTVRVWIEESQVTTLSVRLKRQCDREP